MKCWRLTVPERATTERPRIAFVFGDGGEAAAEHVREAISEHADIVYTTAAKDFDAIRLTDSGATAALVNVDDGDWLEALEARLNAVGVKVVFNDPEISKSLEGWEHARWLRHLSAKLRGSADVDPPRPAPTAPGAAMSRSAVGVVAHQPGDTASEKAAGFPLSDHEIATLTVDFGNPDNPSTGAVKAARVDDSPVEDDTDALSAMIDARLAAVDAKSAGMQAWDPGDTTRTAGGQAVTGNRSAAPAGSEDVAREHPNLSTDNWQLVDSDAGAISAPAPRRAPVEPVLPDSLAGLELVPMDDHAQVQRSNEPVELWIDDREFKSKPKPDPDPDGDKT
jgi:chemosensory pili system protein ChpB (putative protein-glutamate methylesterase)